MKYAIVSAPKPVLRSGSDNVESVVDDYSLWKDYYGVIATYARQNVCVLAYDTKDGGSRLLGVDVHDDRLLLHDTGVDSSVVTEGHVNVSVDVGDLVGDSSRVGGSCIGDSVMSDENKADYGRCGPNGGVSYGRGVNYAKNQAKRDAKRGAARRLRGGISVEQKEHVKDDELAATWRRRRIQENILAEKKAENAVREFEETCVMRSVQKKQNTAQAMLRAAKAEQQLVIVSGQDVKVLQERDRVRVMRDTEVGRAQVERAFSKLSATDNVPSMVGGSAQTIRSGSISPNSSASEAEVRKIQKDLLDSQAENERLKKLIISAKYGISVDDVRLPEPSVAYTLDSAGDVLNDLADEDRAGYIKDGKWHVFDEGKMLEAYADSCDLNVV